MAIPDLKDWLERKPKKKARKRISRVSKRRKSENKEYRMLREKFLLENPLCEVWLRTKRLGDGTTERPQFSTDVHHVKKRGRYLLDVSTWMAVCRENHDWIHRNQGKARELGFLQ